MVIDLLLHLRRTVCLSLIAGLCTVQAAPEVSLDGNRIHIDKGEVRSLAVTPTSPAHLLIALSFDGVLSLSTDARIQDYHDPEDSLAQYVGIAVSDPLPLGERRIILVAMVDWSRFHILLRALDPQTGRFLDDDLIDGEGRLSVPPRTTHLCFARDPYDHSLYLFAGGDHGRLLQYLVYTNDGALAARKRQEIVIGGPTTSCASNDRDGLLHVVEPDMGVWRVITDPEEVPLREPVSLVAPWGQLEEPLAVTMIARETQTSALLADAGLKAMIEIESGTQVANRQPLATEPDPGEIVSLITANLPGRGKVSLTAYTGNGGSGDILISDLQEGTSPPATPDRARSDDAIVQPRAVSAPVTGGMDAADDPAIWIHPADPAQSLVLGADKNTGLGVYDLDGKLLQFLTGSRINNVDVRAGFTDNPALAHIAIGSDRTHTSLAIYAIDAGTRRLGRVEAREIPAGFHDIYGVCLYRSPRSGELYAIADSDIGEVHQWRLFPTADGKVDAELVRRFEVGSVAEGCVVDDENGYLYLAQETVGVWRYGAEPDAGAAREAVAMIEPGGVLTADLEGMAVYRTSERDGYLIITSQGSDNYSVYDRLPPHSYRGTFRIRANPHADIDGTSQTDGIEVTHVPLPGYPDGLFVAQDGRYDETQNFKYVAWRDIAEALGLR